MVWALGLVLVSKLNEYENEFSLKVNEMVFVLFPFINWATNNYEFVQINWIAVSKSQQQLFMDKHVVPIRALNHLQVWKRCNYHNIFHWQLVDSAFEFCKPWAYQPLNYHHFFSPILASLSRYFQKQFPWLSCHLPQRDFLLSAYKSFVLAPHIRSPTQADFLLQERTTWTLK